MFPYLLGVCLASLASLATCVGGLFVFGAMTGERPSPEDMAGFAVLATASALVFSLVLYAPMLAYGRRRWRWSRPRSAVLAAGLLNLPIYVVLATGVARGGLFGGPSEGLIFAVGFAVAAAVFAAVSGAAGN